MYTIPHRYMFVLCLDSHSYYFWRFICAYKNMSWCFMSALFYYLNRPLWIPPFESRYIHFDIQNPVTFSNFFNTECLVHICMIFLGECHRECYKIQICKKKLIQLFFFIVTTNIKATLKKSFHTLSMCKNHFIYIL